MAEYNGLEFRNGMAPALSAQNLNPWNEATVDHGERIAALESAEPTEGSTQPSIDDAVVRATGKNVAFNKEQPVGIILGSSSIYGSGVTPTADRPVKRFARKLERQLQLTHGVPTNRAPFSMIAGDVESGYSNGGSSLQGGLGKFSRLVADGSSITFKSPYPSTGITVGFREGASVGNISVSINGGSPQSVSVGKNGPSKWTGKYKSPEVPRGMNEYTFHVSGGGQVFDFVHFFDDTNDEGPILYNGGWGEGTLGTLMDQQSTTDRVESLNPDFIIIVTGSNEQGNGTAREEFDAMVSRFTTMVAQKTTGPTWLCFIPNARPNTPGYDRTIVIDGCKNAVSQSPATRTYSSVLEEFWTDVQTDKNVLGTLHTDNVHPSTEGHAGIAQKIGEALGLVAGRGTVPQSVFEGAEEQPGPVEVEPEPVDPFTTWTTDSFDSGELAGRSTDAENGGTPQQYDLGSVKESAIADGALTVASSSSAVFLSPGKDDVEASVTYKGQTGNQSWLRTRVKTKAASPRDCVGIRFTRTGDTTANVQIDQKVDNTTTILSPNSVPVSSGQTVGIRVVGDQASLIVNGDVVQTVTTNSSGEHFQILGYNAAITVDDLSIRILKED